VILRFAKPLLEIVSVSVLAGLGWRFARRARVDRMRRLRLLAMELRLADASEALQRTVFRLKHYRVVRPNGVRQNAGLIPSTNVRSLRYIKGRQNED